MPCNVLFECFKFFYVWIPCQVTFCKVLICVLKPMCFWIFTKYKPLSGCFPMFSTYTMLKDIFVHVHAWICWCDTNYFVSCFFISLFLNGSDEFHQNFLFYLSDKTIALLSTIWGIFGLKHSIHLSFPLLWEMMLLNEAHAHSKLLCLLLYLKAKLMLR